MYAECNKKVIKSRIVSHCGAEISQIPKLVSLEKFFLYRNVNTEVVC